MFVFHYSIHSYTFIVAETQEIKYTFIHSFSFLLNLYFVLYFYKENNIGIYFMSWARIKKYKFVSVFLELNIKKSVSVLGVVIFKLLNSPL